MSREACIERKTKETDISLTLGLDAPVGGAAVQVRTGVGFFDHMLTAFACHGGFALSLRVQGDLEVDAHHTMEDTGLALGQAVKNALGDKRGITRFGSSYIPMDESLARVVIDLSGRPHLSWRVSLPEQMVGGVSARLFHEFFQSVANVAGLTLHVDLLACEEGHHGMEAIFKAFGRALAQAVAVSGNAVMSTKGVLE